MSSREELKRLNSVMDEREINETLERFPTLDSFLLANSCYIRDKEVDHREMTHTGLDGRIYHISMRQYPAVIALLIRDLNRINPITYYMCEFLTPEFKMFADFDIESDHEITKKEWELLGATLQGSMVKYYKSGVRAAWFTTHPETKRNQHNEVIYRYGLHIVWWQIITNRRFALAVYALLLAEINRKLPKPEPPSNSWEDRFDKAVYGAHTGKRGSLRWPGCEKMKECKPCKPGRRKAKDAKTGSGGGISSSSSSSSLSTFSDCKYCGGTGKISIGRPYHPQWIFGEDGKIDEEETKKFQNNWNLGLKIGTLRLPSGTLLTDTLEIPDNAPRVFDPLLHAASHTGSHTSLVDKDGDPIKEPKRAISKKLQHLKEFLSFPENYDSWKKNSSKYKFRVDNESIRTLVQTAIREYNENYADVNLIDLRTDKKTRPSSWLCMVDGIGSNFCLNKGKTHGNSGIYFMITPYGDLYQKCNSTRPVDRPYGNVFCSVYASTHRPLPDLVKECLTWKKKDTTEFQSLDEQLHFQKFESKLKEGRVPPPLGILTTPSSASEVKFPEELVESCSTWMVPSRPDKIDVERDARELAAIITKLNKSDGGGGGSGGSRGIVKSSLDESYMRNLYLLNFKCRDAIGGFEKSEKRIDETDLRKIRLTRIPDKRSEKNHKALEEKEASSGRTGGSGSTRGGKGSRGKRKVW